MKHIVVLFILSVVIIASAADVVHVNAAQAAELLAADKAVVVLDVRTADEYAEGHIANARNLDFQEEGFEAAVARLDREAPYLVHCASGGRSTASLAVLKKLGFKRVHHLDGGFNAWRKAGNAVAR
jgi:rhodanese-related sulfurtransferase